jgi:pimeloyl-ACP methyl ester carboxylesterase
MTKRCAAAAVLVSVAVFILACNTSGLSKQPRATFSDLACLDKNGDHRLNAADASDLSSVPDFNGDRKHDANDAAFFNGIDIPLDPPAQADVCRKGSAIGPEYEVAHGYFAPANVSCAGGAHPVLLVGGGGGIKDLTDKGQAAGVRSIIDELQTSFDHRGIDTIAVIAGPAMVGAVQPNTAMEEWMANAVRVYFDRYPCIRAVLVGHSHGGVTVDVMAARLEDRYPERFIDVVELDRVESFYFGDTQSKPKQAHVFSIFETNSGALNGLPYTEAPNAEEWDASRELGPVNGDKGGALKPVIHTTIDDSKSVKQRIIDDVMSRS